MKFCECGADKYICQMCKKIPALDKLVVHHKDRNRKNNSLTNLITLCRSCHGKIHQKDNNKRIKRNLTNEKSVVELRNIGLTFEEIGNKLGFTRQRAFMINTRFNNKGEAILTIDKQSTAW
jgi:hypothetical protein